MHHQITGELIIVLQFLGSCEANLYVYMQSITVPNQVRLVLPWVSLDRLRSLKKVMFTVTARMQVLSKSWIVTGHSWMLTLYDRHP